MSAVDWLVLVGTLAGIVLYGLWQARKSASAKSYLSGGSLSWVTIGLSVMATQASAITFLSTPGLAFEEGMGFVQFYFGLPLAMIVVSAVFVPIYYRLRVVTAYEYLETRFDWRIRVLGSLLFLIQRGMAAGITIYAPSIIMSTILGWPIHVTNVVIGVTVIAYTVSGGTEVVSKTQRQQMIVILVGMAIAGFYLFSLLPEHVGLGDTLELAGLTGRMEVVTTDLDLDNRYNLWSGLAGGFFLALSYFGTDQSQVQRYLGGTSASAARLGLLFNGLFKIPMQFSILLIGIILWGFYLFSPQPVFFNEAALERARKVSPEVVAVEAEFDEALTRRRAAAERVVAAQDSPAARARFQSANQEVAAIRDRARTLVARAADAEEKDADFIFITFVLTMLPMGLVGLLVAVILSAAMSSIASELNALGTTTAVDLVERMNSRGPPQRLDDHARMRLSRLTTMAWGIIALIFASVASLFDNLIEAVNVLGSLFYGTVLGIFIVAFFVKRVGATAVLVGALAAQATVIYLFYQSDIGYLWYNVIGAGIVVAVSIPIQLAMPRGPRR